MYAGASSTKWALLDSSRSVVASGRTPPLSGHVFTPEQQEQNFAALEVLIAALGQNRPQKAVAGITGLGMGDAAAQFYQQALLEVFALQDVAVMSDMDLAYLAHFEPGEGILVYGGTGGIAFHLRPDGSPVRAGGRGYLIADPGGGFSLGQRLLEFVTTQMDLSDTPEQHPLAAAVFAQVGGSNQWAVLREHVYMGGHAAVAAFAPLVGQVYANTRNEDALRLLEQTGQDMALLANRLMRRVGVLPIALAGGVLAVSSQIEHSARVALGGHLEVRVPQLDVALCAAQMALEL
ncbi:MAG: N-acetylglucosamine kinase [Deinococcales bacterium]